MKFTLPTGGYIEGTPTEVARVVSALGLKLDEELYYHSESRGEMLLIADMPTKHIMNAALKMYRKWVEGLSVINHPKVLAATIVEGVPGATWQGLLKEMAKRTEV